MTAVWKPRTVAQAIEDAAASTKTGYRFIEESSENEPFFTHGGIERASARFGGALQALGLQKGDRVALILPDNADFIFAFLGAIRAGIIPVPGGIGVAELGISVGLAAAGLTPEAALATALAFRIATFYLPPLWGFFALRWLQRNRLL